MTTVGELLYNARIGKRLTLEQAEKATKIRLRFLTAMEHNQLEKLPPGTFAKGFVKNYASFLGLPVEEVMAFYRRQVNEEKNRVLPSGASQPIFRRFSLTPPLITSLSVAILLLTFFAYLIFSYIRFAGSPTLVVNSPANNIVVHDDQVEITGKTDPEASLTINDQPVATNQSGSFDVKIQLQPGLNTLSIVATNKFKRQTTTTRNLRLEK